MNEILNVRLITFSIVLIHLVGCAGDPVNTNAVSKHDTNVNTTYKCEYPTNPIMAIIGEDLSGSFPPALSLQPETIRAICQVILKSGRGGQIIVGTVGDPTPKGYVSCEIKPLPYAPKDATLADVAFCKNEADKVTSENSKVIKQFVEQCTTLLSAKGHKITDINGFFRKTKIISQQPGSSKYDIWVFINSDGKQDTPDREKLDCSLRPANVKFYVSNWIVEDDCKADGKFLNPEEFVKFFQSQI